MTVGRAPPISNEGGWCGQGAVPRDRLPQRAGQQSLSHRSVAVANGLGEYQDEKKERLSRSVATSSRKVEV